MHSTGRRKVCKPLLITGSLPCRRHFGTSSGVIARIFGPESLFPTDDVVRLLLAVLVPVRFVDKRVASFINLAVPGLAEADYLDPVAVGV